MYLTSPVNLQNDTELLQIDEAREILKGASHIYAIKADKYVFFEGDRSEYIYEIVEGVVRSTKMLSDGRRQVLNFGYPGDILGLSHDCYYHHDCETVSDVRLRVFKRNACSTMSDKDAAFSQHLLKWAASEVNNMQEHFITLGRKSAMERIASFLCALLDRQGEELDGYLCFNLPMRRSDIADFLGLTIETVSRVLTKLRKEGVIELPSLHRVCVKKPGRLRELAETDHDD